MVDLHRWKTAKIRAQCLETADCLYRLLEVDVSVEEEGILIALKKLRDASQSGRDHRARLRLKKVQRAVQTLLDKELRKKYDQSLLFAYEQRVKRV